MEVQAEVPLVAQYLACGLGAAQAVPYLGAGGDRGHRAAAVHLDGGETRLDLGGQSVPYLGRFIAADP